MPSCHDVASYFLSQSDPEAGDTISNLKLQKLAYYAQGFHLAVFNAPLFSEKIEAWAHGPVVPDLYHRFKAYGSGSIPAADEIEYEPNFPENTQSLLDEVYEVFGQYSAWKLRAMTHNEPPWKDAPQGATISHASLREYFLTRINDA